MATGTLNPKFFNEDNILNPKVRMILLSIIADVKKSAEKELGEKIPWDHDIITGSLIGTNYDNQSDIDLHMILDYSKLPKDKANLMQKFLSFFFKSWNKDNDIDLYGHKVEIYPQIKNEPHFSENTYNLTDNHFEGEIKLDKIAAGPEDHMAAKNYYKKAKNLNLVRCESSEQCLDQYKKVKALWTEIKEMRKKGLAKATQENPFPGLSSHENIVFKLLRRNKTLQLLVDMMRQLKKRIYDKKLIENGKVKSFKEFIKD